jgi:hypothetical protein
MPVVRNPLTARAASPPPPQAQPQPRVPRAEAIVLMVPRLRVLCAQDHRQRVLSALHARGLTTLSLAAPGLVEPALLGLVKRPDLASLRVGLWLDRDAAMLALALAARHPACVKAVVSVNPVLQADSPLLAQVRAATLLLWLGAAEPQGPAQRQAMLQLQCRKRLEQVPLAPRAAADHGATDAVAQIAADGLANQLVDAPVL